MKKERFISCLVAWTFVLVTAASATYFDTGWVEFRQPNGATFIGRMWGDEWDNTFQTVDGYPFDKNSTDGFYYFAFSQRDGIYQLSNLRVGIDLQRNIPRNLSAHIPRPVGLGKQSANPSGPAQATAVTWTLKVIMVEFQDAHGNSSWTRTNFSNMLFSSNFYKSPTQHSPIRKIYAAAIFPLRLLHHLLIHSGWVLFWCNSVIGQQILFYNQGVVR
jgi:hypothetical protein